MRSTGFYSRILSDLGGRGGIQPALINRARFAHFIAENSPIRVRWAVLAMTAATSSSHPNRRTHAEPRAD